MTPLKRPFFHKKTKHTLVPDTAPETVVAIAWEGPDKVTYFDWYPTLNSARFVGLKKHLQGLKVKLYEVGVQDLRMERDIKREVRRVYQEEKFKEYKI